MWVKYNPNPLGKAVGDCTVRAISKALNKPWRAVYLALCRKGLELCDMPSANSVWGSYLADMGFKRKAIPSTCPNCYSLDDFCKEHPRGSYIVCLSGHVVTVINGVLYDSWDSRKETPVYYWEA